MTSSIRRGWIVFLLLITFLAPVQAEEQSPVRHFLYVAAPGIRNDLEFGGAGILVFDMDRNFAWVKRIESPASREAKPDNIKGICPCPATRKLYFSTLR